MNLVTIKTTEKGYRETHQADNKCKAKKSRYVNMELQSVMLHNPGWLEPSMNGVEWLQMKLGEEAGSVYGSLYVMC